RDIVSERSPEPPGLQEIALHINDDEGRTPGFDRKRRRLRFHRHHWHGSPPMVPQRLTHRTTSTPALRCWCPIARTVRCIKDDQRRPFFHHLSPTALIVFL